MTNRGSYRVAAVLALASVALHIAVAATGASPLWLAAAIVAAGLGWLLLRGSRVAAYAAFLLALAGGVVALGEVADTGAGLFGALVAAQWAAALALFVVLWRPKTRQTT